MMQNRMLLPLALAATLAAPVLPPAVAAAAAKKPATASAESPRRRSAALRQFTGVLTALDAGSITVEKSGRAPKTMVFSRNAGMSTTGELARDAHVTVWYRDEGGHAVAHRVVVKAPPVASS